MGAYCAFSGFAISDLQPSSIGINERRNNIFIVIFPLLNLPIDKYFNMRPK